MEGLKKNLYIRRGVMFFSTPHPSQVIKCPSPASSSYLALEVMNQFFASKKPGSMANQPTNQPTNPNIPPPPKKYGLIR